MQTSSCIAVTNTPKDRMLTVGNIKKIAKLLGYREKEVEEDIFNMGYLKEKGRCFEKFTRDVLGVKKC